jgi:hypothetical protein
MNDFTPTIIEDRVPIDEIVEWLNDESADA